MKNRTASFEEQIGNIDTNILSKILSSTFIVCDITPETNLGKANPNVMFELGIASSWKLPEQVIVVSQGGQRVTPEVPAGRQAHWCSAA